MVRLVKRSWVIGLLSFVAFSKADDAPAIPAPFAPFEYLVGGWKGSGIPQANRLKGWTEKHNWAWKFQKGAPVGMTVTLENDKLLSSAELTYDAPTKTYRLAGKDPDDKAVAYAGTLDASGKVLTLQRSGVPTGSPKERITFRPNSEKIRYTIVVDRQEPGAPQYSKFLEMGVTKEGEAFAAGGATANLPKCIVTGGTATMTVSYQGKTYDLCCTGCRDEFNENPEKYVKKALARTQASSKDSAKTSSSGGRDDGAFDGLLDSSKPKAVAPEDAASKSKAMTKPKAEPPKSEPKDEPSTEKAAAPRASGDPSARAASLLRLGQALEKSGKPSGALEYYRQIIKDYSSAPQAKAAAERIKAIEKK